MAYFEIADPKSVFRGLTYGQWVGVWYNNLLSDRPDIVYREGKGMAFLRGNVEFSYEQQEDPENPKYKVYSSMTNEQRITIQEDTAILVPVISTMFMLGEEYQGQALNDELSIRAAARRDTVNGGEIGLQIRQSPDDAPVRLVDDLDNYYVETSLFPLSVSESSSIRKTIELPDCIDSGQYLALVAGVFVIISKLNAEFLYRLSFYGRGVGRYTTRSVYDISVKKGTGRLTDISGGTNVSGGTTISNVRGNVMDFVGKWQDKEATK